MPCLVPGDPSRRSAPEDLERSGLSVSLHASPSATLMHLQDGVHTIRADFPANSNQKSANVSHISPCDSSISYTLMAIMASAPTPPPTHNMPCSAAVLACP